MKLARQHKCAKQRGGTLAALILAFALVVAGYLLVDALILPFLTQVTPGIEWPLKQMRLIGVALFSIGGFAMGMKAGK